ncbi:hypothetical protein [Maribacter sp. 4G9]|uniref:hypothetical protein n=1 Tax=Maribacter sp. 4G9 TaxID=1889777 RepID=UPI000C15B0BD|nr:hypothetical protein [Maribacter sp. 4G9]PIB27164.1 hypothetical protein BFP75_07635 [Maribacter sp. 4G9]
MGDKEIENLDKILAYCIEKYKTDNKEIFSIELKQKLFIDLELDHIDEMIKTIYNYDLKVADIEIEYNPSIIKNGFTEIFLNNGGFKKVYMDKEENKSKTTYNTINIGGDNKGNIAQSLDNALASPVRQKAVHTIENKPNKRSWIEILYWIIGSIVGLLLIYEFIIKNLANKI